MPINPPSYRAQSYWDPASAFANLEAELRRLSWSGSFHLGAPSSRGERTLELWGAAGSRLGQIDISWDPQLQRFMHWGQGSFQFAGSPRDAASEVQRVLAEAGIMHAMDPSLLGPIVSPDPRQQIGAEEYTRMPLGEGFYTGGPLDPSYVAWQRATRYTGSIPGVGPIPDYANVPSWVQANLPPDYYINPRNMRNVNLRYGVRATEADIFNYLPGYEAMSGYVGMLQAPGKAAARIRAEVNRAPSTTYQPFARPGGLYPLMEEQFVGLREIEGWGEPIVRQGVAAPTAYVPGLHILGAGQIQVSEDWARSFWAVQNKSYTAPLEYTNMLAAVEAGIPLATAPQRGVSFSPHDKPWSIGGLSIGPPDTGAMAFRALPSSLELPYSQGLAPFIQGILPQQFTSQQIGGYGIDVLNRPAGTAEMRAAQEQWAAAIRANPMFQSYFPGVDVNFGGTYSSPRLRYGAELQYAPQTGMLGRLGSAIKGQIAVGPMIEGLEGMGAVVGGEAIKNVGALYSMLANSLPQQAFAEFAQATGSPYDPGWWRGTQFAPGASPAANQLVMAMMSEQNRGIFNRIGGPYGVGIHQVTVTQPLDLAMAELYRSAPGIGGRNRVISRGGLPYLQQTLEALTGVTVGNVGGYVASGNLGQMNFMDLMELAENDPQVATQISRILTPGMEAYLSPMLGVTGANAASRVMNVGPSGMAIPTGLSQALDFISRNAADPISRERLTAQWSAPGAQIPLKFQLEAMAADPRFSGMNLRFGQGRGAYTMETPEALLHNLPFDEFGNPVGYGRTIEALLRQAGGGQPEGGSLGSLVAQARRGQLGFAVSQSVIKGAAAGGRNLGTVTGPGVWVQGMPTDANYMVVSDPKYQEMVAAMERAGMPIGDQGYVEGVALRWPMNVHGFPAETGGRIVSATRAVELGARNINVESFGGAIGWTDPALVELSKLDQDGDTLSVFPYLHRADPSISPLQRTRMAILETARVRYPDLVAQLERDGRARTLSPFAMSLYFESAGVPGKIRDALTMAADLVAGGTPGGAEQVADFGKIEYWANQKFGSPGGMVATHELLNASTLAAEGDTRIGYADMYTNAIRGAMRYAGITSQTSKDALVVLGDIKQQLVDNSRFMRAPDMGDPLRSQQAAANLLFGATTAQMGRGGSGWQITAGAVATPGQRHIVPGGMAGVARYEIMGLVRGAGVTPEQMAEALGGTMETIDPDLAKVIRQSAGTGPVDVPWLGLSGAEAERRYAATPIGLYREGAMAFEAYTRWQEMDVRVRRGQPLTAAEQAQYKSIPEMLGSGRYDAAMQRFEAVRASQFIGGNRPALPDAASMQAGDTARRQGYGTVSELMSAVGMAYATMPGEAGLVARTTPQGKAEYPSYVPVSERMARLQRDEPAVPMGPGADRGEYTGVPLHPSALGKDKWAIAAGKLFGDDEYETPEARFGKAVHKAFKARIDAIKPEEKARLAARGYDVSTIETETTLPTQTVGGYVFQGTPDLLLGGMGPTPAIFDIKTGRASTRPEARERTRLQESAYGLMNVARGGRLPALYTLEVPTDPASIPEFGTPEYIEAVRAKAGQAFEMLLSGGGTEVVPMTEEKVAAAAGIYVTAERAARAITRKVGGILGRLGEARKREIAAQGFGAQIRYVTEAYETPTPKGGDRMTPDDISEGGAGGHPPGWRQIWRRRPVGAHEGSHDEFWSDDPTSSFLEGEGELISRWVPPEVAARGERLGAANRRLQAMRGGYQLASSLRQPTGLDMYFRGGLDRYMPAPPSSPEAAINEDARQQISPARSAAQRGPATWQHGAQWLQRARDIREIQDPAARRSAALALGEEYGQAPDVQRAQGLKRSDIRAIAGGWAGSTVLGHLETAMEKAGGYRGGEDEAAREFGLTGQRILDSASTERYGMAGARPGTREGVLKETVDVVKSRLLAMADQFEVGSKEWERLHKSVKDLDTSVKSYDKALKRGMGEEGEGALGRQAAEMDLRSTLGEITGAGGILGGPGGGGGGGGLGGLLGAVGGAFGKDFQNIWGRLTGRDKLIGGFELMFAQRMRTMFVEPFAAAGQQYAGDVMQARAAAAGLGLPGMAEIPVVQGAVQQQQAFRTAGSYYNMMYGAESGMAAGALNAAGPLAPALGMGAGTFFGMSMLGMPALGAVAGLGMAGVGLANWAGGVMTPGGQADSMRALLNARADWNAGGSQFDRGTSLMGMEWAALGTMAREAGGIAPAIQAAFADRGQGGVGAALIRQAQGVAQETYGAFMGQRMAGRATGVGDRPYPGAMRSSGWAGAVLTNFGRAPVGMPTTETVQAGTAYALADWSAIAPEQRGPALAAAADDLSRRTGVDTTQAQQIIVNAMRMMPSGVDTGLGREGFELLTTANLDPTQFAVSEYQARTGALPTAGQEGQLGAIIERYAPARSRGTIGRGPSREVQAAATQATIQQAYGNLAARLGVPGQRIYEMISAAGGRVQTPAGVDAGFFQAQLQAGDPIAAAFAYAQTGVGFTEAQRGLGVDLGPLTGDPRAQWIGARFQYHGFESGNQLSTAAYEADRIGLSLGGAAREGWEGRGVSQFGGFTGARFNLQASAIQSQRAGLGIAAAQLALTQRYTTGEGMPGGRGFWQIEDDFTRLTREQQDWGFEFQGRQMAMQRRQFGEQWSTNVARFQTQTGWQAEDMGVARAQMLRQRAWTREDWSRQDDIRAMTWGWQQEDMAENVRFSTGRQRRIAVRERERATILHGTEEEQIRTERERQKETEKWQDDEWKKQRQRWEQTTKWREEDFDREKKYFDEGMKMQEEARQKEREFLLERRELEDEQRKLSREYWKEQQKLQEQQLGIQAQQITNAQDQLNLAIEQETINAKTQVYKWTVSLEGKNKIRLEGGPGGRPKNSSGSPDERDEAGAQFGGVARAGEPIRVGEGGPEVFVPDEPGLIRPAFAVQRPMIGVSAGGASSPGGAFGSGLGDTRNALVLISALTMLAKEMQKVSPDSARAVKNAMAVLKV